MISGDEDITTQAFRRAALSRAFSAQADLRVELGGLAFADPSVMIDLAMVARRLRMAGRRMFVGRAQPQVARVIEAVGLHRLPGVSVEGYAPSLH